MRYSGLPGSSTIPVAMRSWFEPLMDRAPRRDSPLNAGTSAVAAETCSGRHRFAGSIGGRGVSFVLTRCCLSRASFSLVVVPGSGW